MAPGEPELALRRCLDARTRRWAAAEFFYSAVDRPWFMQNELKVSQSPLEISCCPHCMAFACTHLWLPSFDCSASCHVRLVRS